MEETIFDAEFFRKLGTLQLNTNIVLEHGAGGPRKSLSKGSGVEFSDFREYILGDDIRTIDWNAYGRMNRLYVKQFMEEKEEQYHIFIDTSMSMEYGQQKKSIHSLRIAGALSYMILQQLDRVTVTCLGEKNTQSIRGLTGRQSFMKLIKSLEKITAQGEVDIAKQIMGYPFTRKGTVILLSDFFHPTNLKSCLRYLAYAKQEIILVHILAREELNPELEGTLNLIDMENEKELKVTMTSKVLRNYEKTVQQFITTIKEEGKRYQATYIQSITDQPLEQFLFTCVKMGKVR